MQISEIFKFWSICGRQILDVIRLHMSNGAIFAVLRRIYTANLVLRRFEVEPNEFKSLEITNLTIFLRANLVPICGACEIE